MHAATDDDVRAGALSCFHLARGPVFFFLVAGSGNSFHLSLLAVDVQKQRQPAIKKSIPSPAIAGSKHNTRRLDKSRSVYYASAPKIQVVRSSGRIALAETPGRPGLQSEIL